MELDETDPANWLKMEAAVDEYIQSYPIAFKSACERLLLPFQQEDRLSDNLKSNNGSKMKGSGTGLALIFAVSLCRPFSLM